MKGHNRIYVMGVVLIILFCAPFVEAHGDKSEGITVSNAYIQEVPPGAANSAAYMEIKNGNGSDKILTSVSTPICRAAELHRSSHKGGLMRMERVDSVEIKAGESVILTPMGLHIMLIGLKKSLKVGREMPITLTFGGGSTVTVKALVGKTTP